MSNFSLSRSSVYCHWRSITWQFNLVSLWKEGVESKNKIMVSLKKSRNTANDTGRVKLLRFERLHDIQKLIVNVRAITKLHLDLIKVEKRVFHAKFPHGVQELLNQVNSPSYRGKN
jgi:hypothetical protein